MRKLFGPGEEIELRNLFGLSGESIRDAKGETMSNAVNAVVQRNDAVNALVQRNDAVNVAGIPEGIRGCVLSKTGEYDARRLRSQREIIRDVMLSAAESETWLTLGELRAITRYGDASISAQLRHLRRAENGGYRIEKRHREGVSSARPGVDGRGECVWEYRISRG